MDVISEVSRLLEPFVAHHGFTVSDVDLLGSSVVGQFGRFAIHTMCARRRLLLLCLYQVPAEQMMIAQLWSLGVPKVKPSESTFDPIDSHMRVWRYDASTALDELARQIVNVVTGWLEPNGSHARPDFRHFGHVDATR
jgi:hypothetical protein